MKTTTRGMARLLGHYDTKFIERLMTHTAAGRERHVFLDFDGVARQMPVGDPLIGRVPTERMVGTYDREAGVDDIAEDLIAVRESLGIQTR